MAPIAVSVKIRQGRKTCTLLSGFEAFGLRSDVLADELRKACAGATSGAFPLSPRCLLQLHPRSRPITCCVRNESMLTLLA